MGFCIDRNYENAYSAYYINRIAVSNETSFITINPDSQQFSFDVNTYYYFDTPLSFTKGKNRVGYIDISFVEVTLTPVTNVPTTQPEYNIYLTNQTNYENLSKSFTTLQPDFKLDFNFYDYVNNKYTITYNFTKSTIEKNQSFLDSIKFKDNNNFAYIDIILNSDGYKLKNITKDVSYNNMIIYDCTRNYTTTNNNLISIDTTYIMFDTYINVSNTECLPQLYIHNKIDIRGLDLTCYFTPQYSLNTIQPVTINVSDLVDSTFNSDNNAMGNVIAYMLDGTDVHNILCNDTVVNLSNIQVADSNYSADAIGSYTLYYNIKRDNKITEYSIEAPAHYGCTMKDIYIHWFGDTYSLNNSPVYLTFTKLEYNSGVTTQSYLNNSYINVSTSYNSYIQ